MQPEAVVVLEPGEFPVTRTGKVSRRELAEGFEQGRYEGIQLMSASGGEEGWVDEVTLSGDVRKMAELWQHCLGLPELPGPEVNFYDVGGDSMSGVSLIHDAEKAFQRQVDVSAFFTNPTVLGLCESLLPVGGEEAPVLVRLNSAVSGVPLFLIPGGKGTPNELMVFASLARKFATQRPVFGLRAPSERYGEGKGLTVAELASLYREVIKEEQTEGPYLICGEYIAGVVSQELARQLAAEGDPVGSLLLLDAVCPTEERSRSFEADGLDRMTEKHGPGLGKRAYSYFRELHRFRPVPSDVDTTIIATATMVDSAGRDLGWGDTVGEGLRVELLPEDHDSYIREEAEVTGRLIGRILDEASGVVSNSEGESAVVI